MLEIREVRRGEGEKSCFGAAPIGRDWRGRMGKSRDGAVVGESR